MLQRSYNDYLRHLNKDNSNSLSDWLVVLQTHPPDTAHPTPDEGTFRWAQGDPRLAGVKAEGTGQINAK